MYRAYIIDELYTFIEKRRRIIATITYLSVGKSDYFHLFLPWKQTVSTGETNSFYGGN